MATIDEEGSTGQRHIPKDSLKVTKFDEAGNPTSIRDFHEKYPRIENERVLGNQPKITASGSTHSATPAKIHVHTYGANFRQNLQKGLSRTREAIRKEVNPTNAELDIKTARINKKAQYREAKNRLAKARSKNYGGSLLGPSTRRSNRNIVVREPVDLTLGGLLGGSGGHSTSKKKKKVDYTLNGLL